MHARPPLTPSVRELAAQLANGAVSCAELAERALSRLDGVAALRGVAFRDDDAVRAEAAAIDADHARGVLRGPLHGVPFSVKDWIETTPFPCSAGQPRFADRRPARDATVVARLRAAGALVVATSSIGPHSALHGMPISPLDPTRTPGHSSAGEAIMVATATSAFGIGSDSGGSIRFPAHCCGLVGLRPTYGRVPLTGHFPRVGQQFDGRTVIGPLTRTVDDARTVLDVISGADGRDPACHPMPPPREPISAHGLRVAVHRVGLAGHFEPVAADAVDRAAAALADAGCALTDDDVLDVDESLDITQRYWGRSRLSGAEVDRLLTDWDRSRVRALRLLDRYDAVLSPAAPHIAPQLGETSDADWTYLLSASLWGWPAIVVPVAEPDEMPSGVQLMAGPWNDGACLALASVVESRRLGTTVTATIG